MDTEALYDFVERMDPETFVKIHGATFCDHYLKLPEDFDSYKHQHNLRDAIEFFDEAVGYELVREKIRDYVTTLDDNDKVAFFNNDFTLEQINLDLDGETDVALHEDFMDYYYDNPWSGWGLHVFMYEIHKEFIKDKIYQRDKQIDEILAE